MTIKIKKLKEDAILPRYAHPGDAGMDLFSNEEFLLRAGERHLYKTGISMELPSGYVSLVWDKSSLPYHHGIKSMGGVIDATYRGEYGVILFNTSQEDYLIKKGDKIVLSGFGTFYVGKVKDKQVVPFGHEDKRQTIKSHRVVNFRVGKPLKKEVW